MLGGEVQLPNTSPLSSAEERDSPTVGVTGSNPVEGTTVGQTC